MCPDRHLIRVTHPNDPLDLLLSSTKIWLGRSWTWSREMRHIHEQIDWAMEVEEREK